MKARIYLRASTQDQDAERAKGLLQDFCDSNNIDGIATYVENISGTQLDRPELTRLLAESEQGEILLVESVDRLSRLSYENWEVLKSMIANKGLRLVVVDLPTTHSLLKSDDFTASILNIINNMLLDLMATMARLDNDKRIERIKQGQDKARQQGKRIGGRDKDIKLRQEISKLTERGLKASEVAKLLGCGVATVYRARKGN